ncbi:hypothetical protein ACFTXL_21560 [Bacillus subtilis]|uniref:hypothetical protein n=1 Tax=Bacillus subtilis TaxID=1423 RepID=UPI0005C22A97|nr:hypothetical protein [Bacillus subtilis]AYK76625.1 hypothetical protein D9C12_23055 [Bacillus subtilis subsp. subtilis]AYL03255.1 hypothetical protein D9C08_23210 [Bacillus subtilis subsp. subtilis]MCB4338714.1 hypothetical protein [Bacillus subtilis]UWJ03584.1 hypothetical protein N0B18_22710 [Bacillus subtilis]
MVREFLISYTLPIFMILFLAVTLFREMRTNKNEERSNKSFIRQMALTVIVTLVLISAISYMIISMT